MEHLLQAILTELEALKLRRALSGEVTQEVKYIASQMEKIERHLEKIMDGQPAYDFSSAVIIVLLGLILWRVW